MPALTASPCPSVNLDTDIPGPSRALLDFERSIVVPSLRDGASVVIGELY